jgi:hypothetical protein
VDVSYYRRREQDERACAARAWNDAARASHLDLAERYREVIDAYERCNPADDS